MVRYIISIPTTRPAIVGPAKNLPPFERLTNLPMVTTAWNTAPAPIARNTMAARGDATKPPIQVPTIAGAPAMIPSAIKY